MIEYGVDFETYYETSRGSSYSLKKMTVHDYVHDDRFDAYMVAIFSDEGTIYTGPPEDAPWEEMEGQTWVSHNMSFDYQVYQRLVELGKVKAIYPEHWHCTANLSAYLQAPRNLQAACRHLLDVDLSKEVRDEMANKSYYDLTLEEKKEWLDYAIDDAKYCLQLWKRYKDQWPETERFISMATIMQGIQGVNIHIDKLEKGKHVLKDIIFDASQKIPWRKDYVLLSTKGMKAECAKQGIAPPPTTSQKDNRFDKWVEKHKDYNIDWIQAVGDIRKANKCLKFLETVDSRIRPCGTMYFSTKYFGAAVTGRWSGESGLNMQNLTKNQTFGVGVRDLFIPRKGKVFIISDLSQIEPRALNWMAGNDEFLDFVRDGADCYEAHARASMGYIDPRPLKEVDGKMRQYAKARVLGAGYGASGERFVEIAKIMAGLDLSIAEACRTIDDFRKSNKKIVKMWNKLTRAFRNHNRGQTFEIEIPSGRYLRYFDCDGETATQLRGHPSRHRFWGSKLTENLTQATARDVLCYHWKLLAEEGYDILWNVHDELIIEVDEAQAEEHRSTVEQIMSVTPPWMGDCPIAAEAQIATEYCK